MLCHGALFSYLKVLFPVKHDRLCLHLPILNINLVPAQHDGDILTHPDQIPMPVRHVFVRHARCNVKHDNGALPLDVVTVAKAAKFLLTSRVPDVESNRAPVGVEDERMDLHSQRGWGPRGRRGGRGGGEVSRCKSVDIRLYLRNGQENISKKGVIINFNVSMLQNPNP